MSAKPRIFFTELLRYGIVALLSYGLLYAGSIFFVEKISFSPQLSYFITLSIIYIGVYLSYTSFVFKGCFNIKTLKRFILALIYIWILNNAFFYLTNTILNIHYIIAITLNIFILGGVRFLLQKYYVFNENNENKKVALTFDLELWHEGDWLKPFIKDEVNKKDALIESVTPLLMTLKKYNHKATFFVTDKVVRLYPNVIKSIFEEGHEIASHSVGHQKLQRISQETFKKEMGVHCLEIKKITNKSPLGFRAPHFSLNEETSWALPVLEDLGFVYDSSIFPIKTTEYGVKDAPRNVYKISKENIATHSETATLIELPQSTLTTPLGRIPVGGGIYFRLLPLWIFSLMLSIAIKTNSTPMIYFHPHELYSKTPQIKGPFLKTLLKYWGVKRSFKKFKVLMKKFQFDSIENIWNFR